MPQICTTASNIYNLNSPVIQVINFSHSLSIILLEIIKYNLKISFEEYDFIYVYPNTVNNTEW